MKKLFLASVAAYSIDKFIDFLKLEPTKSTVAFIPTASNTYLNWSPIEDRTKLIELGFTVKDVNLENKTKEQLNIEMKSIDLIFVAGGNTFYLLQEVRKSKFDEIVTDLINRGIPYIGSSAGTLLAGASIELAVNIDNQQDAPELENYNALNLVDFVVLPHCNDERFRKKIDINLRKFKGRKYEIIKINDDQAVLVNGSEIKIV